MADLIFQQANPAADTDTTLHTGTASKRAILNLNVCNTGASAAKIRVWIDNGGTVAYIEHGQPLSASGGGGNVLERTALKLPAGALLKVRADTADVDFTLDGVEEAV